MNWFNAQLLPPKCLEPMLNRLGLKLSSVPAATTYFLETVLPRDRFILKLDSSRIVRLEGLKLLESVFVHRVQYLFIWRGRII